MKPLISALECAKSGIKGVMTNPKAVYIRADIIKDEKIADSETVKRLKAMVDETLNLGTRVR